MKKYDSAAGRQISYRRAGIERSIDNIKRVLSGYDNIIDPVIEDDDGRIDNVKLDAVTDDMMSALSRYLENEGKQIPSGEQAEFYRRFIYLTVTSPYIDTETRDGYYSFYSKIRYGTLIELSRSEIGPWDRRELISYEQKPWEDPSDEQSGILFTAKEAYRVLTGRDISEDYDSEEREILSGLAAEWNGAGTTPVTPEDILAGISRQANGIPLPDEMEETEDQFADIRVETDEERAERLIDEANHIYERQERLIQEANDLIDRWKAHIPDAGRFAEEYLRFRSLLVSGAIDMDRFREDIESMVDTYLYEKELSVYALDKYYSLVDRSMEGMANRISRDILRARMLADE